MLPELQTAFLLLGIGMVTVFTILGFVVLSGKLLIRISNHLAPVINTEAHKQIPQTIKHDKIAAITAAMHQFAGGQMIIDKIEKIEEA